MEEGRDPRDLLHEELATGKRPTGRPQLFSGDIYKRDLKALQYAINADTRDVLAPDRSSRGQELQRCLTV